MENEGWGTSKAFGDILSSYMQRHTWQVDHLKYRLVCKLWRESCELPQIRIAENVSDLPIAVLLPVFSRTSTFRVPAAPPPDCLRKIVQTINDAVDTKRFPAPVHLEIGYPLALEDFKIFLDSLKSNRWIHSIAISAGPKDADAFSASMAQFLSTDLSIRSIDVSNVSMTASQFLVVMGAIRSNSTLQRLCVRNWYFGSPSPGALAATFQNDFFRNFGLLQEVFLGCCSLGDEGAVAVAHVLRRPEVALRDLRMGVNGIGDVGATAISEALENNTTLRHLDIWSNRIHDAGASAIGRMLQKNTTLTRLNISSNYIVKDGVVDIAAALSKTGCALRDISFWSNDLVDHAVEILSTALCSNTSLVTLNLAANKFGSTGCCALAEALKTNQTLQHLDVSMNKLKKQAVEYLIEAIGVNPALVSVNVHDGSPNSDIEKRTREAVENVGNRTQRDLKALH
eukprot:TRINITY_DN12092_c0_g1_i1.p1 TRINITY_DN12092_c0_g1~~TRINITY_DN12092_c0_g1_i1.p1  ORF type:complete len:477 (-),score=33.61 TRINITY_DN12092_c0_g1_i1:121-1485(-)